MPKVKVNGKWINKIIKKEEQPERLQTFTKKEEKMPRPIRRRPK